MKKKLDRETILALNDTPLEEVEIAEWGGSVWVKKLSGTERDAWEIGNSRDNHQHLRARLAILCVCDESGKPMFKMTDLHALGTKSATAFDKIWEVASRVNKLTPEEVKVLEGK